MFYTLNCRPGKQIHHCANVLPPIEIGFLASGIAANAIVALLSLDLAGGSLAGWQEQFQ